MKKIIILSLLLLGFVMAAQNSFLDEQKKYKRVRDALEEKNELILKSLSDTYLNIEKLNILFIAYKDEAILELYAKDKDNSSYKLLKRYDIVSNSGTLGPKSAQGDRQVPEGFYHINRFNPFSNFYLSLGINYPNAADKLRSDAKNLGGDIFIHGSFVTIGCLPMSDDKIKEIYLYAVFAKNNNQTNIPIYIFPFKMTEKNISKFSQKYNNDKKLLAFWQNLKEGHDKFSNTKEGLKFTTKKDGLYVFE
ncbi:MAG: L,D-transpeptidase family protein [Campylobacteraceae bacterium]|jgi:murein L,D-transpeptidase YafK|nr:L,D-transpeptidase family protein [Campylobacteraceae bacterium]